jgi:hypothetical protein
MEIVRADIQRARYQQHETGKLNQTSNALVAAGGYAAWKGCVV